VLSATIQIWRQSPARPLPTPVALPPVALPGQKEWLTALILAQAGRQEEAQRVWAEAERVMPPYLNGRRKHLN